MSTATETSVDRGRATSIELDAEAAAVLGYLFSFLAAIVVLVGEEENEFVRFHVFQSAVYNLLVGAGFVGFFLVGTVLVWAGTVLVFLLVGPLTLLVAAPNGGALAAFAGFGFSLVVSVLFALVFGGTVLLTLFPLVAAVPVLAYLVYAAYRASQGERYAMPYVGDFVEQYV